MSDGSYSAPACLHREKEDEQIALSRSSWQQQEICLVPVRIVREKCERTAAKQSVQREEEDRTMNHDETLKKNKPDGGFLECNDGLDVSFQFQFKFIS